MFRARNSDPVTSFMAADAADNLAFVHSLAIVDCLEKHGKLGKDGIANHTGLSSVQVARQVKEIEKAGLIELTGDKMRSNTGRYEQEWRIGINP